MFFKKLLYNLFMIVVLFIVEKFISFPVKSSKRRSRENKIYNSKSNFLLVYRFLPEKKYHYSNQAIFDFFFQNMILRFYYSLELEIHPNDFHLKNINSYNSIFPQRKIPCIGNSFQPFN